MKTRRVTLVGCGHHKNKYLNHEGYPDPTAGCAISGSKNIYGARADKRPGEKERTVYRKILPVSEMDAVLAALDM